MIKNFIPLHWSWMLLFAAVVIPFFWFMGQSLHMGFDYWRFSKEVIPEAMHWDIQKTEKEQFFIRARYNYVINGVSYSGDWTFEKKSFGNPFLAEEVLHLWQKQLWKVWIDPTRPSISTLERIFPMKPLIKAFISFCIFLYFVWLKLYARQSVI